MPFREGEHYRESGLRRADGGTSKGAFGRAVRPLPQAEFQAILQAGFAGDLPEWDMEGVDEQPPPYHRPIEERLVRRVVFRDVTFRRPRLPAPGGSDRRGQ